jgi:hypothetical protein
MRLNRWVRMSANIKSLAMSVLQRHAVVSIQSQPFESGETGLKLAETAPEVQPLGAGHGVLTLADMPELGERLRLTGWEVIRKGNELVCSLGKKLRIQ